MIGVWNLRVCRLAVAAIFIATGVGCSAAESGASPSFASGFPFGTWTSTITSDDLVVVSDDQLASLGMSRTDLAKENSGTFTMTLGSDGSWSTVQQSDQQVRWPVFRGTLTTTGAGAFDEVTSFPPDFAGDIVHYQWRTENGLLHLIVPNAPDPIIKAVTEAHPWSPAG